MGDCDKAFEALMDGMKLRILSPDKRPFHELLDHVLQYAEVDEIDGAFHCKRCNHLVRIDWFEKEAGCTGCDNLDGLIS